jgi:hypothetical protein
MQKITLLFLLFYKGICAQTDTTVFADLKKIESHGFVMQAPYKWKVIDMADPKTEEQKFNFTGVGLPETFNNEPLTATFSVRKFECAGLETAEDYSLGIMTSYPDKITPAGYNYEKDTLKIASGETATLYSTHFYRQTKHFNFTEYNLVVYSTKRTAAYLVNIVYKYKDPTYNIEKSLHLKDYALRIYKGFVLR